MTHRDKHISSRLYVINLFGMYAIIRIRSSCYLRYLHLSKMLGTLF